MRSCWRGSARLRARLRAYQGESTGKQRSGRSRHADLTYELKLVPLPSLKHRFFWHSKLMILLTLPLSGNQRGDRPDYEGLLELFPQNYHEPYYLSYIKEDCRATGTQ